MSAASMETTMVSMQVALSGAKPHLKSDESDRACVRLAFLKMHGVGPWHSAHSSQFQMFR